MLALRFTPEKQASQANLGFTVAGFNLGYVFHDLLMGEWFHAREPFAREHFDVALIALAFAVYSVVLAHLFPIYRRHFSHRPAWQVGLGFGWMMGVMFDALQGGIIEIATFQMPLEVFFVDSGYHVFVEGSLAGLILAAVQGRASLADAAAPSR